ncbi:hypothetical protein VNO80_18975 [Phaseolus coccineus]|uniref:Uncharacterized protein n=1 Tax=Phaseolus coccineus TaxID=3886 RepID=A0AAN9QZV7_PHACN
MRERLTWRSRSDVASTLHSISQALSKANAPSVPAFAIHALFACHLVRFSSSFLYVTRTISHTRSLLLLFPNSISTVHSNPNHSKVITTCGTQNSKEYGVSSPKASRVSLVEETIKPRSHATQPRANPTSIEVQRGPRYSLHPSLISVQSLYFKKMTRDKQRMGSIWYKTMDRAAEEQTPCSQS